MSKRKKRCCELNEVEMTYDIFTWDRFLFLDPLTVVSSPPASSSSLPDTEPLSAVMTLLLPTVNAGDCCVSPATKEVLRIILSDTVDVWPTPYS